ncbi:MAG: 2-amino-4-hydroxy-6-hydroxymethyldihydropteridine diphosphokinase [Bryobacteraceae bacterium]
MKRVYLSLGSNLGDCQALLSRALERLAGAGLRLLRVSSVYETEPLERRHQPWFLNLVVEAETELFPRMLLMRIQRIEAELGRKRLAPKGPRTIDIDILLYGDAVIESPDLVIPHPRMSARRFVLEPLAELAPDLHHPVSGRPVRELLEATRNQTVRRVAFRPTVPA